MYNTCVECKSNVPALSSLNEVGYAYNEQLGKGTYGTVETYISPQFGGKVAVKRMTPRSELYPDVLREISTLVALNPHPDIIRIHAFVVSQQQQAVVLELGLMSLRDALQNRLVGSIDGFEARSVLFQMLRGLAYMNSEDIWHRDIKPGNVIITQYRPHIKVKLADFGLSRSGPWCGIDHTEVMYTLWYRPPEILINQFLPDFLPAYNASAEMWAVGVVMWEIITANIGRISQGMLKGSDPKTQLKKIVSALGRSQFAFAEPVLHELFGERSSVHRRDSPLLLQAAQIDPKGETGKLLYGLLAPNCTQRMSVFQALDHPFFQPVRSKVQALLYAKDQPLPKPLKKCDRYLKLLQQERTTVSLDCIRILPGGTSLEKFQNYTLATDAMLRYSLDAGLQKNEHVLSFSLGVFLLKCVFSTMQERRIETPEELTSLCMSCLSLSSKYYSPRSLKRKIESTNVQEREVFSMIGGQLHLPTSLRFLNELIGCPRDETDEAMRLYAWCVGVLFAVEQTRAAFIGKPSELARLSVHIVTHYFGLDPTKGKGSTVCFSLHGIMPTQDIIKGSELAHSSLSTLHPDVLADLVYDVARVIEMLDSREESLPQRLTPPEFLKIIRGETRSTYVLDAPLLTTVVGKRSRGEDSWEYSDVADDYDDDDDEVTDFISVVENVYQKV